MNYLSILFAALSAIATHAVSIRVGNFNISASDVGGTPVKFTLGTALAALEQFAAGKTGTFQVGDVQITIAAN